MKASRKVNQIERKNHPYKHLEFILKNTTASQRLHWLQEAWDFHRAISKNSFKPLK